MGETRRLYREGASEVVFNNHPLFGRADRTWRGSPGDGEPERNRYYPDEDLEAAANAALLLERPLLLTGEAGCGKTEFAWAAARRLAEVDGGHPETAVPLECHIRSDSLATDLLYKYDAVQRFGDLYAARAADCPPSVGRSPSPENQVHHVGKSRNYDVRCYMRLETLGIALMSPVRRVVLLDEIDKAPRDLPNDLLHELDQKYFEIYEIPLDADEEDAPGKGTYAGSPLPSDAGEVDQSDLDMRMLLAVTGHSAALDAGEEHAPGPNETRRTAYLDPITGTIPLRRKMIRPEGAPAPFVVITSNVERQLPEAFLRRCVFYHIPPPDETRLKDILSDRCRTLGQPLLTRTIDLFRALRQVKLTKKPGTAELIDWGTTLSRLFDPAKVTRHLEPLTQAVEKRREEILDKGGDASDLPWSLLPAPGCLLKLNEDLEKIGRAGARGYAG